MGFPERAEFHCRKGLFFRRVEFVSKRGEKGSSFSSSSIPTTTDELPPGLTLIPDFITEEEEEKLLGLVDAGEWDHSIRRRVVVGRV